MTDLAFPGLIEPAKRKGPDLDRGQHPLTAIILLGVLAAGLLCPGLVGKDHAVARHRIPVRVGRGGLKRLQNRADGLAILVEHFREHEVVLLGIGVLNVADRTLGLGNIGGYAFVALGADADRRD
jgi:hypothetical protein